MSRVAALMLVKAAVPRAPAMGPALPSAQTATPGSIASLLVAVPEPPAGPDIGSGIDARGGELVTLARKLRLVHGHLLRTALDGDARCNVPKSSGDTRVGKLACDAARACAQKWPARNTPARNTPAFNTPAQKMPACTREEQARRVEGPAWKRIEEEQKN